MKRPTLTALKWGLVAALATFIVTVDLWRTRSFGAFDAIRERLLLDTPLILGAAIFVFLVFRFVGGMHAEVASRNTELLALHEAALDVAGDLDLDALLQKVVDRACQLLDARYGALAVYDEGGRIETFITSGISEVERRRMGAPPVGRGLLGAVLHANETIRVRELVSHPGRSGFPPGHPTMSSLLAVPILSRPPWRGNLYLAEKRRAAEFSAEDETVLRRFAAQSAIAIDVAQLHRQLHATAISEERQRIAHEMHDGLAQVLASVITGAQAVREHLRHGRIDEAMEILDQLASAANTTYIETREGILALRAAGASSEQPFDRLLSDYVTDWQDRTGIAVSSAIEPDIDLPTSTELQLVRIAQEALANVRKHSGARSVEVRLARSGDELRLEVTDDGRGFEERSSGSQRAPRFGLATMRERAQSIGGTLEFRSIAGRGTTVELRMPLSSQRDSRENET